MSDQPLPPDVAAYLVESAVTVCRSKGLGKDSTMEEVAAVLQSEARTISEGAIRRQIALIEQIMAPKHSEGMERLLSVLMIRIYHQALRRASVEEERMQCQNALIKIERYSLEDVWGMIS